MSNLNKAFLIEKTGNIMTPRGRLLYPDLFKPTQVKGQGKFKYRVTLLVPKTADIEFLRAEIAAVEKSARFKGKFQRPLKDTKDEPRFADLADEFPILIRANSDNRPQVLNASATRTITEDEAPDEVYGGRWGRLSISVYPYFDKPSDGITFGLSNVQLLENDEPIGGGRVAASSEFEAVEEGDMAGMED